jgi:hypothetical protein
VLGAVGFIILVSIAARTWLLAHRPLWFDELFTIWAARLSLPRLVEVLRADSGPPLWYLLEKPFVAAGERLFSSDVLARVPSLLATVLLFAGAWALPSRAARVRFVVLASASPLLLLYSAEARAYSLLALLCFALFLLALRGSETPQRLLAVLLLTAAALYTHYLALFAAGALAVVAAAERRLKSSLALAAGALPFLFWVPVMSVQPRAAVAWMHESPRELLAGILSAFGGAGDVPAPFGSPLPGLLVVAGIAISLALSPARARLWKPGDDVRRAAAFVVLYLGGVLFASLARPVAFAGRTEMAILPVWLWTAALAADRSRAARFASAAMVVVSVAASAILLAAPRETPTAIQALGRIARDARPGDLLVAGAHFYLPARLDADRGRLAVPVHAFPPEQAAHPGWSVSVRPRPEDLAAVQALLDRAGPGGRVFFQVPPSYRVALAPVLSRRGVTRRLAETPEMLVTVWSAR